MSIADPGPVTDRDAQQRCWVCGGHAELSKKYATVPLLSCVECGFVFAPDRSEEELRELYGDQYFDDFHGTGSYLNDEAQHRFVARVRRDWISQFVDRGNLFEVGAAAGFVLDEFRTAGFEVMGVEPADGMSAFARERLQIDVRTGFIEDVDLPEGAFDVICAWHVIEHIRDPGPTIERMAQALAGGGHMFVEVPNIDSISARRFGAEWYHLDPRHHVGFYNAKTLTMLLESHGLSVLATETVSAYDYLMPAEANRTSRFVALAKNVLVTRSLPHHSHPWKHEMLRAVAQR